MSKKLILTLFFVGFVLISPQKSEAATQTVRIYPTDDGLTQLYDGDNQRVWSTARSYAGTLVTNPISDSGHIPLRADAANAGLYRIYRGSLVFDTSVIPDDAIINSVALKVYKSATDNINSPDIVLTTHTRDSVANLSKVDWQIGKYGTAALSRRTLLDNQYTTFALGSQNFGVIDLDNYTTLGFLNGYDFDNTDPGRLHNASTFYSTENPGTEFDPYLEITYEVPEPEDEFPRYTQGTSTYPSLVETMGWANDVFAYGSEEWCGDTVGGCGCAITSGVMAGRNAGILTDVLGKDVNPKNINEYLRSVGGYTSDGSVYWLAMQSYLGEFTGGQLSSRFKYLDTFSGAATMPAVDEYLATTGTHALLAFKNRLGHFVWLPEKTETGYVVRDPLWYLTETANDTFGTHIKDYDNSFDSVRVFEILDEPEVYSGYKVESYIQGTAEMLYHDAVGNRVGYSDGAVVIGLDRSSYGNAEVIGLNGVPSTAAGGKHLLVYEAGDTFSLDVVGTGSGSYKLEFFTISATGEVTTFEFSGTTLSGVSTTFNFDLVTGEATEQPLSYEQFLQIINLELSGATDQEKKFFLKWTQKIFDDLEEKTVTQAIQSIKVYKKLLVAKKVVTPTLTAALDLLQLEIQQ